MEIIREVIVALLDMDAKLAKTFALVQSMCPHENKELRKVAGCPGSVKYQYQCMDCSVWLEVESDPSQWEEYECQSERLKEAAIKKAVEKAAGGSI